LVRDKQNFLDLKEGKISIIHLQTKKIRKTFIKFFQTLQGEKINFKIKNKTKLTKQNKLIY